MLLYGLIIFCIFALMLYYRRKILLSLLQVFGGKLNAIHLQKLLFLFTRTQTEKSFDFVPYQYGCFSFQANQDLCTMQKYGYINYPDNKTVELISKDDFFVLLDMFDQAEMNHLKVKFGDMNTGDVVKYTYREYPYYAINSKIAHRLMNAEELERIEKQKRHFEEPTLFTIGYEGLSLEAYINKLIINDVRLLCDVRKNAFSQKYGFSKSQLAMACTGVGIKYVHVPQLGIESEKRENLRSQRDYDILFDEYEHTTLTQNIEVLLYVRGLIDTHKRIALTCFERDPKQCHRSRVAKALMQLPNRNYSIKIL